jgi:hypothetical protein
LTPIRAMFIHSIFLFKYVPTTSQLSIKTASK